MSDKNFSKCKLKIEKNKESNRQTVISQNIKQTQNSEIHKIYQIGENDKN